MKELRYTKQFKKDLKRYLNQPKKLQELNDILDKLIIISRWLPMFRACGCGSRSSLRCESACVGQG